MKPAVRIERDLRYPEGTPLWVFMYDYYCQVARDAEAMGKKLKAKRFRNKTYKVLWKDTGKGARL